MNDAADLAQQAERRLLGAIMWTGHIPDLPADVWARPSHQAVWDAICTVAAEARTIEPPAVMEQLAHDGRLTEVGGATAFFESFVSGGTTLAPFEVDRLATEVADWQWRRGLFTRGRQLMVASSDLSADPRTLLAELETLDTPRRAGLALHSGDQIGRVPDPAWLVDGHMQEGLAVIFGPWAAGKSFVAADLAVALASGKPWWGWDVTQGPVLYLALEGAAGLAARIETAARVRGVGLDGLHLSGDPVNLGVRSDVADVDTAVRQTGARLLVVDTWARATAGADENDNGSAGRAIEALDRIRQRRGCTVLVLHHARKGDAADPRGAGSLPAAADSIWNVVKTGANKIKVTSAKQKDGEDFQALTFSLRQQARSASLELIASGKPRAQADLDRAEALDALQAGAMLKALVRAQFGDATLAELCAHPDVCEVLDEQERPCVALKAAR